jgi:mono/diheme cytochrome c family protein
VPCALDIGHWILNFDGKKTIGMQFLRRNKLLLIIAVLLVTVLVFTFSIRKDAIDFNTQVKPIFNKKCIICHGGVRRKANFSLLFRSEALAKAESGKFAIVPGEPDKSEMIRRLSLKDPEERMPYKHEALSQAEIDILKKWIKEGAQWGDHWAYVPVKDVDVPKPKTSFFGLLAAGKPAWVKNDID